MGCICSKGSSDHLENHVKDKSSKRFVASLRREEVVVEVDGGGANDASTRLITTEASEANVGSALNALDEEEKKEVVVFEKHIDDWSSGGQTTQIPKVFSVRNGVDGAQVSAGWPSWLSAVAGEAIGGWVPRKADSFEKLDKIGQGTYSSVYRARDLVTRKIVALKKVRFVNMDPESVRFMAREIVILRRLDHPNVMKLEGLVTSKTSGNLYLVFEYMEHDLAGLAASPSIKFSEQQIKCYMLQLLRGLEHCHNRGVLHRDIKGSNLLIGNDGNLKIGDFGLSTFYRTNPKQPLTSRVVTLWYRPPELLLGATDYGVAVDLWSAGCILAELFAGKPIMPGRTEVEQLHKIFKLCGSPSEEYWKRSKLPHATIFKPQNPYKRCVTETFKDFPRSTLALLDVLLAVEPEGRGSAASALTSEFFTTKPLPCDPASLPKYPPSKEFDAKLRDEEARRQRAASCKGRGHESHKKGTRESKAVPAPDANAEIQTSIQKRQAQSNPKSNSEQFNPKEDGGSGFLLEPSRGPKQNGLFSGPLNSNITSKESFDSMSAAELRSHKPYKPQGAAAAQLSMFSGSVASHGSSRFDIISRETSAHPQWPGPRYNQHSDADSSHLLDRPNSSYKKDGHQVGKDSTMGYCSKKNQIQYSGPLLPRSGDIEEMLKEHEKQIQHAVRKACLGKKKSKKAYGNNAQAAELLLHIGGNGR